MKVKSQSEGGEKKEIKDPTFKMFTLHKVYNINCDSISYRGRDKILEKEKTKERRIFYFSACLICRELFNSGSRQLSRFSTANTRILHFVRENCFS